MEGKTLIRVLVVTLCLALTGLGYRNSNGIADADVWEWQFRDWRL